jgi:uncharacterized protein YkuJ
VMKLLPSLAVMFSAASLAFACPEFLSYDPSTSELTYKCCDGKVYKKIVASQAKYFVIGEDGKSTEGKIEHFAELLKNVDKDKMATLAFDVKTEQEKITEVKYFKDAKRFNITFTKFDAVKKELTYKHFDNTSVTKPMSAAAKFIVIDMDGKSTERKFEHLDELVKDLSDEKKGTLKLNVTTEKEKIIEVKFFKAGKN